MAAAQVKRLPVGSAFGWAIVAGVLYALSQPSWGAWPLAAVCLVPLLLALARQSARVRMLLGWTAGTVATLLSTVVPATVGSTAYFEIPIWMGVVIALTVGQIFGAGTFALAALLIGDPARPRPVVAAARVGVAWVSAEFVRANLLTGLPWLFLAHGLAPMPALIQSASIGGELMVSLWLAALNCAFARVVPTAGRREAAAIALAISAAVGVSALSFRFPAASLTSPAEALAGGGRSSDDVHREGEVRVSGRNRAAGDIRVLLTQPNLPNAWRGDPSRVSDALERLVDLSGSSGVDVAIWPENAVNVLLPMNSALISAATRELDSLPEYIMLGTPRFDPKAPARLFNSAVLFGPERRIESFHDKVHLLPFAEYTPWPLDLALGDRTETSGGERPVVLVAGGARLGPLICYEIVFAEIARSLVHDGAELIINISNDAWFGSTGAIEQHFAAAVFRAVETRRPVLRATNTGVTAAIDSMGHVVARLPSERLDSLTVDVVPAREISPYVRFGPWLPWSCLILSFVAGAGDVLGWIRRQTHPAGGDGRGI